MSITIQDVHPVNREYGLYQGVPIARHYIDAYFQELGDRISGKVLEFGWPTYASRVSCDYEIIDMDPDNSQANIHADICDDTAAECRPEYFDFIICTAVLQLVPDPQKAVNNLHRMLKPGGALLLAEKSLSIMDPWSGNIDRWRFTPRGLCHLLRDFSKVDLRSYGNVYAVCAYLMGLPASEIEPEKLDYADPGYPLVSIAYAEK